MKNIIFREIDSVEVPEIMRTPIKTGMAAVDKQLSMIEGLIPSQVMMFTGIPGGGKTTLMMVMLDRMTQEPVVSSLFKAHKPLFISLEMSDFQLRMQTERLGRFKGVFIMSDSDMPEGANIDNLISSIRSFKPTILIVDSIQELQTILGKPDSYQRVIVKKFTDHDTERFSRIRNF